MRDEEARSMATAACPPLTSHDSGRKEKCQENKYHLAGAIPCTNGTQSRSCNLF